MQALCFLALLLPSMAQAASCADTVSTGEAFQECAQKEILPLEARVVHLFNAARNKYKRDPELLKELDRTEDAWNVYRNGHCSIEARARGKGSDIETKRAFQACAKRTLEARIKELEGL